MNHFSTHTAPFPFLPNLFVAFEVKLLTNSRKLPVAKEVATFASVFLNKLANQEPKEPPD